MNGSDALSVLVFLLLASFMLVLNLLSGAVWLKVLSIWSMIAFVVLAGWTAISAAF